MKPQTAATQRQEELSALSRAGGALWLSTLSLMTAYLRHSSPAHRYLLACRIARNFDTLRAQECFAPQAQASFSRLALRWHDKAQMLSPATARRA